MRLSQNNFIALLGIAGFALVACGGGGSTGGNTGGSGSTTGTSTGGHGGNGGSGGTTNATGTGGHGGGGGGASGVCGGKMGATCGQDQWCKFDMQGGCGNGDGTGTCQAKPTDCNQDCPGVCGCDGEFYCNECIAHAAGVDVSQATNCTPSDGGTNAVYTAFNLNNAIPRFVIFKADTVRNVCSRIYVEANDAMIVDIQASQGWSVFKAEITDNANDCVLLNGYPVSPSGEHFDAMEGTGSLAINGTAMCSVNIHAKLSFAAGSPSWVPAQGERFDADMLDVSGGCQ